MDRNWNLVDQAPEHRGSLSARRAWIEIKLFRVAALCRRSLSARRAWIEITIKIVFDLYTGVALRKESVDRNVAVALAVSGLRGRSPQGERG